MKQADKLYSKEKVVAIIGAGLSGLAAGIRLLQLKQGHRVTIYEKSTKPGGNCREITVEGLRYEMGCNDFGNTIDSMLSELGVHVAFQSVKHQLIFPHTSIRIPFDWTSMWTLFYPRDIWRLCWAMQAKNSKVTLRTLVAQLKNAHLQQMLTGLLAYFLFRSPNHVSLELINQTSMSPYEYNYPKIPVGGSRAIIDALCDRFKALGGKIQYCAEVIKCTENKTKSANAIKINNLKTNTEECINANFCLSSVHGWAQYPKNALSSLPITVLLFQLKPEFQYPQGVHTTVFFPKDTMGWIDTHEKGALAENFAFHCFTNAYLNQKSPNRSHAITVYFLSPRGKLTYTEKEKETIGNYIKDVLNQTLKGFRDSLQNEEFYSPECYKKQFGTLSYILPHIIPSQDVTDFKHQYFDPENQMYYIGNAVNSPVDQHAAGALDSAKIVTTLISGKLLVANQKPQPNSTILKTSFALAITGFAFYFLIKKGCWKNIYNSLMQCCAYYHKHINPCLPVTFAAVSSLCQWRTQASLSNKLSDSSDVNEPNIPT